MCAVLMIAVLAVAVPDREDPTPKEKARPLQEQLLGEWLLVKSVVGGVEDKNFMGTTITFTPTELSIREGRQELSQELSYHLDAAKTPAVIDLVMKRDGGEKIQGIIKVEGDQLTLCFNHGGVGERPSAFVSAPNTSNALMHFKRVKK